MSKAYVYYWQELSTNKWYIGSRTRKGCHPNDGYITSSKIVRPLVQANPADWKRTIIAAGEPNDMRNFEMVLLKALDAKNDLMSYNRHNGDGAFTTLGIKMPEEFRQQVSKRFKGRKLTDEVKKKISLRRKGQVAPNKGKPTSQETKDKISKRHKGRTLSLEWRQKLSIANKGKPSPNKGRIVSEETRRKISEKGKGKIPWNKGLKLKTT